MLLECSWAWQLPSRMAGCKRAWPFCVLKTCAACTALLPLLCPGSWLPDILLHLHSIALLCSGRRQCCCFWVRALREGWVTAASSSPRPGPAVQAQPRLYNKGNCHARTPRSPISPLPPLAVTTPPRSCPASLLHRPSPIPPASAAPATARLCSSLARPPCPPACLSSFFLLGAVTWQRGDSV